MSSPRAKIQQDFADKFISREKTQPISLDEIGWVELELSVNLPGAYVTFVTTYGAPGSSPLPTQAPAAGFGRFLHAEQIIKNARLHWSSGMNTDFVPIAVAPSGCIFGFYLKKQMARTDDTAVLSLDLITGKIDEAASSFDQWLAYFSAASAAQ